MNSEGPGSITSARWRHITNAKGALCLEPSPKKNKTFSACFGSRKRSAKWPNAFKKYVFAEWARRRPSVFVCDAALVCVRKQEAALMLGNRVDFHLGDTVIAAALSALLVMLETNGSFVSIQIYFQSRHRKKKQKTQRHHYPVQMAWNETTPDMTSEKPQIMLETCWQRVS